MMGEASTFAWRKVAIGRPPYHTLYYQVPVASIVTRSHYYVPINCQEDSDLHGLCHSTNDSSSSTIRDGLTTEKCCS